MGIGRKKIAEAARAFAAECAAGTAPELGINFSSPGCAVQRLAERGGAQASDGSAGYCLGLELCRCGDRAGRALTALYKANDEAPPEKRAAAVVAPLNALAEALEAEQ